MQEKNVDLVERQQPSARFTEENGPATRSRGNDTLNHTVKSISRWNRERMRRNLKGATQVSVILVASVASSGIVLGDIAPPPPEFPIGGIEVPSAITAFIAAALFGVAVSAVLHKRGLIAGSKWWATAVVVVLFAAFSAGVCNSIHSEHRAAFEKQQQKKWEEAAKYMTN